MGRDKEGFGVFLKFRALSDRKSSSYGSILLLFSTRDRTHLRKTVLFLSLMFFCPMRAWIRICITSLSWREIQSFAQNLCLPESIATGQKGQSALGFRSRVQV